MTESEISLAKPVMEVTDKVRQIVEDAFYAGKAKGREEVVDFIEERFGYFTNEGLAKIIIDDNGYYGREGSIAEWQAKLKKWGIGE